MVCLPKEQSWPLTNTVPLGHPFHLNTVSFWWQVEENILFWEGSTVPGGSLNSLRPHHSRGSSSPSALFSKRWAVRPFEVPGWSNLASFWFFMLGPHLKNSKTNELDKSRKFKCWFTLGQICLKPCGPEFIPFTVKSWAMGCTLATSWIVFKRFLNAYFKRSWSLSWLNIFNWISCHFGWNWLITLDFLKISCHSDSTLCWGWRGVESAVCWWGDVTVTPVPISAYGGKQHKLAYETYSSF